MLSQVESLMYLDQHAEDAANVDEMAKVSFLRQQDVAFICNKIKKVTKDVKEKKKHHTCCPKKWRKRRHLHWHKERGW